jgi:DNA-binding protein HU-beta
MAKEVRFKGCGCGCSGFFHDGVQKALKKKDGKVTLSDSGLFKIRRKVSKRRNPQTGNRLKSSQRI